MRLRLSRPLKFVGPALVTACLVAAVRLPPAFADHRLPALAALAAASVFFAGLSAYVASRGGFGRSIAARYAVTPAFFSLSASCFLLLVEGSLWRIALIAASSAALYVWFSYVDGMRTEPGRFTTDGFAHLVRVLRVTAAFFFLSFCFGITVFMQVPVWIPALAVLVATGIVAWETLWHAKRSSREEFPLIVAVALVSAQLYVALSFLPTSAMVNAAVATTLVAFALHFAERIFDGIGAGRGLRRHFAMTAALVVLVLATARWA
jgi:hypothetical protein